MKDLSLVESQSRGEKTACWFVKGKTYIYLLLSAIGSYVNQEAPWTE